MHYLQYCIPEKNREGIDVKADASSEIDKGIKCRIVTIIWILLVVLLLYVIVR